MTSTLPSNSAILFLAALAIEEWMEPHKPLSDETTINKLLASSDSMAAVSAFL